MKVYLTLALFQGVPISVTAHMSRDSATLTEVLWLAEMGIHTEEQRKAKARNGTEFRFRETEL